MKDLFYQKLMNRYIASEELEKEDPMAVEEMFHGGLQESLGLALDAFSVVGEETLGAYT